MFDSNNLFNGASVVQRSLRESCLLKVGRWEDIANGQNWLGACFGFIGNGNLCRFSFMGMMGILKYTHRLPMHVTMVVHA